MHIPGSPALLFLVAAPALAQDPWAPVRQLVIDERSPDSFTLVATPPGLDFAWYGEHSLGASDGRELRLLAAKRGKAEETLTRLMKGPGWALYDPGGNRLGDGKGIPSPEKVQELMEGTGWKPLREGLKAHLRLHPDDGQAWLELAFDLARQASAAKMAGSFSNSLRTKLREELLPCLQKLIELPEAEATFREPRPQPFGVLLLFLKVTELDQDPELRQSVRQLQAAVPRLVAQDPESQQLWQTTSWTNNLEEPDWVAAERNLFASLEPAPGRPWPPLFIADDIERFYLGRPDEAFQIAAQAIATSQSPSVACRLGRGHVLQALGAWGAMQFNSLLTRRKGDEAAALLASLRSQAGKGWSQVSTRLQECLARQLRYEEEEKIPMEERWNPQRVETLRQVLQEPPAPDPLPPDCTPLRLAMLGGSADFVGWGKLQIHRALAPWGPFELSWQPLKSEEAFLLRERHGWAQEPRWLLMRRDQVLASGPGLPSATVLETALRGQGMPELEVLDHFIRAHPERLDARRARLALLRARLPNPHLERIFLRDLEAAEEPLSFLPFEPDPEVWDPVARRVGLRSAERLRSWPFNASAWTCYASWSALDSRLPRPAALLATLNTWPRQMARRLPGPIPLAVSKAVVEVLRSQGRRKELDAWMQVIWDGGLKAWVTQWAALPPLGRNAGGGWLDRAAPDAKQLMAAWGETLAKEGEKARLAALRAELEDLRKGLSTMLNAAGDRSQSERPF